jgi:hypothetical protein
MILVLHKSKDLERLKCCLVDGNKLMRTEFQLQILRILS